MYTQPEQIEVKAFDKSKQDQRAITGVLYVVHQALKNGEYHTPLGTFTPELITWMVKEGLIIPYKDIRYYIWNGRNGYRLWQKMEKAVNISFIKGNRAHLTRRNFWENVDVLLSAKNTHYTFTPKNYKLLSVMQKEADQIDWESEQAEKDYNLHKEWEADCEKALLPEKET